KSESAATKKHQGRRFGNLRDINQDELRKRVDDLVRVTQVIHHKCPARETSCNGGEKNIGGVVLNDDKRISESRSESIHNRQRQGRIEQRRTVRDHNLIELACLSSAELD